MDHRVGKSASGEWSTSLPVISPSRHLKAKGHEVTHTILPGSKETAQHRVDWWLGLVVWYFPDLVFPMKKWVFTKENVRFI